jgi:hypothetical protein
MILEQILELNLEQLLQYGDPQVTEFAQLLKDIKSALDEKKLTQQEYVSLMVDAERLKDIIALMERQALNVKINDAIKIIVEIAKAANIL